MSARPRATASRRARAASHAMARSGRPPDGLYRDLFAASPDGILVVDAESLRVIEFNDAACRHLGYTRKEFVDLRIPDFVTSLSEQEIAAAVATALDQGSVEVDTLQRTKSGEIRNVHVRARKCHLEGRVVFCAILRDDTDSARAQQQLRDSERLIREAQSIARLGSYALDLRTGTWASSGVLDDIVGIDDQYARTLDGWIALVHPEWRERARVRLAEVIDRHDPFDVQYPVIRQNDGRVRWVHGLGVIESGEDGRPLRMIGTISDITERREVETALRLQAAALSAAVDAIVITDREGSIAWVNPAFTQLTGYSADEVVGRNPRLLKSNRHPPEFYEEFWATIVGGRTWHGEMINRRKDGSLYTEAQAVTPILDAMGAITHFVAIKEDVTERQQLEAQLRQAQRVESVGQLASGIAHDFNNLLTVINGTSELAMTQVDPDDPLHADLREIHDAGARAATLTRQLLAFSRQQILEPRVLTLNTVVSGVESLLRRLLGENIDLAVALAQELGQVNADPGQIEQAITNLAVNARDAMPGGGKLIIETRNVTIDEASARSKGAIVPSGAYVLLSVIDSGGGMDQATLARIFEPFFTTKGLGRGTGLGLSTVFGIVKQSHGFILVESEVGRGTRFHIYLPRVTAAPDEAARPEPAASAGAGTETILVVEDSAGLRRLAMRILGSAGYTVFGAASGEEAITLLKRHDAMVHLLLSDVVLPGMSGRELAEQVAQARSEMKVLYMSGYTSDTIIRHGVLAGSMPFLHKPFTALALLRKIREALDS